MKSLISILFLAFASLFVQEEKNSSLQFEIKNAGITVNGEFTELDHNIKFNPKDLKNSFIEGKAKVISIKTGIDLRDQHLHGRQYFKADKYPYIIMRTKKLKKTGKNSYLGDFELQIKDIIKPIQIPFTMNINGDEQVFKSTFLINRLDYEIGEESIILGDEVKIKIHIKNPVNH